MKAEEYVQAFTALQRLLLIVNPEFGEGRWQWEHSIHQLPPQLLSRGQWYRSQSQGFIHVDENLNGEYLRTLPADVDPAIVIDVPPARCPTVLDTMKSLLPHMDSPQRFQTTLDNLAKLVENGHAQDVLREFQQAAFAETVRGPEAVLKYFATTAEFYNGDGLLQGNATASEAGAFVLIQSLANAISEDKRNFVRICGMLSAPGVRSIEESAGRMVRDSIVNGLSLQVSDVLAAMQRQGDGLVDAAREGFHPLGHPEAMLEFYYTGLFQSAPYLRAAMLGYEVAAQQPVLDQKQRRFYLTRANASEEKLARVSDAMMFSVRDQDGSQARSKRAAVQAQLAVGDQQKAKALAMETVDLKLFLPKPYKEYLLRP